MTFDLQTTLLVAGAAVAVVLLLWLMLRAFNRRQSITPEAGDQPAQDEPYAVSRDRPYMSPPPAGGPQVERSLDPGVLPSAETAPTTMLPHAAETDADIAQPAVPLPGDLAGIAFPPGATDHGDDLTRLKGVGPKLAARLGELGVTRYEQLASLDAAGLAVLDAKLGSFNGRLARDRVSEQARFLASGDRAGFEAAFGKLGG